MLSHYEGLHVARSQRVDRTQRVDGTRAPVSGDPSSAHAAGRRSCGQWIDRGESAVSLLSRIARTAISTMARSPRSGARAAASGQPATDPHLNACQPCRTRYAAFTAGSTGSATTRGPRLTRRFPPSALPRSRRRSCGASKRSSVQPASRVPEVRPSGDVDAGARAAVGCCGGGRGPRHRPGRRTVRRHPRRAARRPARTRRADRAHEPVHRPGDSVGRHSGERHVGVGRNPVLRRSDAERSRCRRSCRWTTSPRGRATSSIAQCATPQAAHFPQGPRHERGRRRRARGRLPQRDRRRRSCAGFPATARAGSRSIWRASSASATASIGRSTMRTRRGGASPTATSF